MSRLLWVDLVRLLAILMLICCHSADPFNFFPDPQPVDIADYQWWGAVWGSLMRPCVPLFAMMTGALLLPTLSGQTSPTEPFGKDRQTSPSDSSTLTLGYMLHHRISRVFWPFLIWSVIYALFPWLLGVFGFAPDTILTFFPYSGEEAMKQSLEVSIGYITIIPLNFNIIAVHMWYIYMLIGLYLYLPILGSWVRGAKESEKRIFLLLWCITLFIPYLHKFVNSTLWGECDWNSFGMLYYFAGFNGYLLLGHYLRHHVLRPSRAIPIGTVLLIVGYLLTLNGYWWVQGQPHEGADLELFWFYCSPQVVMMTSGLFLMLASLTDTLTPGKPNALSDKHLAAINRWGSRLTRCGFGIYMIHYMMTGPSVVLMRQLGVPIGLQIPCGALMVFLLSWSLTALLLRLTGRAGKYLMG